MVKVREDITSWIMSEHGVQGSRLTVVRQVDDYVKPNGTRIAQYLCECNCKDHKQIVARMDAIKSGRVKSCGCLVPEINAAYLKKGSINKDYSDQNLWTVYMHINKINGKRYIGITCQDVSKRWKSGGSGYKNNSYFWNAIQKYGWDNFEHKIILIDETLEYACKVEQCLIKHYKSNDRNYGYNLTDGGEGQSGHKLSDEHKEKLRQANLGKSPSQETRNKISKANKGRVKTSEERLKLSQAMSLKTGELNSHYGKPHSEESKRKISESNKLAMSDPNVRAKIGKANNGARHGGTVPLYCPELNECFWGGQDVLNKYGIRHVLEVRNDKNKSAGKHPKTGEKLHWKDATVHQYRHRLLNTLNEIIYEMS